MSVKSFLKKIPSLRSAKRTMDEWRRKFIYWKIKTWTRPCPDLFITYDNEALTDGAGAQLQRIYAIYCCARLFKVSYHHTPIKRLDYLGLTAMENNNTDQAVVAEYSSIFAIPSVSLPPEGTRVKTIKSLNPDELTRLKEECFDERAPLLVRVAFAYPITELFPEAYCFAREVSPYKRGIQGPLRIAVHVRRGELFVVDSDRMLPNSYYISAINNARNVASRLGLTCTVSLYTELPSKAFTVTTSSAGVGGRIPGPILVDPRSNFLEDFDVIENLDKQINTHPIATLEGLATSDILITSRSSFSFLSAILGPRPIVLFSRFWHNPLPGWILTEKDGSFDESALVAQLKDRCFAAVSPQVRPRSNKGKL